MDPFLEEIKEIEWNKLDSTTRFLMRRINMQSTSDLARGISIPKPGTYMIMEPDVQSLQFFLVYGFGLITLMCLAVQLYLSIIGILFAISLFVLVYWFFQKEKAKMNAAGPLIIDFEQITANGKRFEWRDIYDTAILIMPGSRGSIAPSLILASKDMESYEKVNLLIYGRFQSERYHQMLAVNIEYFKKRGG